MSKRFALLLLLLSALISVSAQADNRNRILKIMTRNLDTGTDFGFVLTAATPLQFVLGDTATFQEIEASRMAERAGGIAAEIASERPDLVALQEVTIVRIGPFGGPATTVTDDALGSLLLALAQLGQHYAPIAIQQNSDLEGPAFDASFQLFDVRVTDLDVMLVRTDLPVSELQIDAVEQQHYSTFVSLSNPFGVTTPIPRGWIAVDAKLRGKHYRVIDTHLETFDLHVQAAQAWELLNGPAVSDSAVIIAGDLNSDANDPNPLTSPAYNILINGRFSDTWSIAHPGSPGNTWPLHGEDPFTPSSTSTIRIDLIMFLDGSDELHVADVALVGASPNDLTPSGLWPSDHAGVVASMVLQPANQSAQ